MGKIRWADRYDSLIQYWCQAYEMPWRILKAQLFAESSMDPNAVSSAGAMGLAQFMKLTVPEYFTDAQRDPYDPEEAMKAMAKYDLKLLFRVKLRFHETDVTGDEVFAWRCAICAYNCGWGYVKTALQSLEHSSTPTTWPAVVQELKKTVYNGKSPDVAKCVPYAEKVISGEEVFLP